MHLLNTETYKLHLNVLINDRTPPYAILSHKWLDPNDREIKFEHLDPSINPAGLINNKLEASHSDSFFKVKGACDIAKSQKLKWIWIDTCCINKANNTELSEALISMFRWYNQAEICYVFLPDVSRSITDTLRKASNSNPSYNPDKKTNIFNSIWFTRGWTLQELLASRSAQFFTNDWTPIGTKTSLQAFLSSDTGIEEIYLKDPDLLIRAPVAVKMSWMVGRTTGRIEDIAYSMLGIFDVTMDARYGEGTEAFMRLQQAIIEQKPSDESIFAWIAPKGTTLTCLRNPSFDPTDGWGVLAPSPDCFRNSKRVVTNQERTARPGRGYIWTQQGIQFQMSIVPGTESTNIFGLMKNENDAPLNCWIPDPSKKGGLAAVILRLRKGNGTNEFVRKDCDSFYCKRGGKPGTTRSLLIDQGALAIRPVTVAHFNVKRWG